MCRLQGAPDPYALPVARHQVDFKAAASGFVESIQCEQIGLASLVLGGGRNKQDDIIDPSAGIELRKKGGYAVEKGERLPPSSNTRPA